MATLTEGELLRQFFEKAKAVGLPIDCGASGSPAAQIIVVGEAPGEREAQMNVPMVGASGQKLWKCLDEIGIRRQDCYVTNVSKRQMSLSAKGDAKIELKGTELAHWKGLLDWELEQLPNKKIILALGGTALEALTGETGITNWRGSVLEYRGIPVVATFNPAMILREPKYDPIFRFDMFKIDRVLRGTFKHVEPNVLINPSPREALREIERLRDELHPISWDIETISGETACHGFANSREQAVCINFRTARTNRFSLAEERDVRKAIAALFADERLQWITQNGNFDSYWTWFKDRIVPPRIWFDTLLAHHTLYSNLPHGLGFLTTQYTDHPYYKDEKDDWKEGGEIDTFWQYNGKDCCYTWEIHEKELQELKDQGLEKFFFDHVMRLMPHLSMMTVLGLKIDVSLKGELITSLREEVEQYRQKFIRFARHALNDPNYECNPRSVPQMHDLLFNKLKLIGRGFSTDDENRDRMLRHPKTPEAAKAMLNALTTYKEQDKFLGTYAEMEIDGDGRARCEYKQFGTKAAPGRLSSSKVLWGTGMNFQNQPQKAQKMFIADEGYEFTYCDASQAEARVVAWLWNVKLLKENFIKAFADQSFDIHRGNASAIFKLPYDEIPSYDRLELGTHTDDPLRDGEPTKRFLGKRCVHGLNYRMQAQKLADVCGIAFNQALEAYNSYHRAFPEIREAWQEIVETVKRTKELWTPFGRRNIWLEPLYTEEQLESVVAFVPQSTIGDKIASVIYKCHEDPDWPKSKRTGVSEASVKPVFPHTAGLEAVMKLNIHDALIAMHLPQHREQVYAVMKKHMEEPIYIKGEPVVIPADFKRSLPDEKGIHRWSTIAKIKK